MTDAELDQYKSGRLKSQLDFFDKKAGHNKFWYFICALYILGIPVLVSILLLLFQNTVTASILSSTVAFVAGALGLSRFHEEWLRYRATWDMLKEESELHKASVGAYKDSEDRNALFVERAEQIMSSERSKWLSCNTPESKEKGR